MKEADCHEQKQELTRKSKGRGMSLAEKTIYWVKPFILAIISIPFVLLSAYVLVFYAPRVRPIDKYGLMASIAVFALSSTLLYFSLSTFVGMARRKMLSGSFLPVREDLIALRLRNHRSALWKRLITSGLFCMIAIGATHRLMETRLHWHASMWIIPALMWAAAILVTLGCFLPTEPKWILPALAIVWCSAGFYYAVGVLVSRLRGGEYWEFPAVMFLISAIAGIGAIRGAEFTQRPAIPPEG
jgi:hypothetical protein